MGRNFFSLNELGEIAKGRFQPETDGPNRLFSGQIRVNFRQLAERNRKQKRGVKPLFEIAEY
jgi:hypothetical protein